MLKFDTIFENKITQNILAWLSLFLLLMVTISANNKWVAAISLILLIAPPIYITNLFILPFFKRKKSIFFILFAIAILFFSFVLMSILNYFMNDAFDWVKFMNFTGIMTFMLVFAISVKLVRDSFVLKQQEKEAELRLLKAQLNPHFLFNTLNNLYGLSVLKSDKLPELMLKLSDLLRYSLYDTKETQVPLEKEVTYLENYISLEKIRLEEKTNIEFNKSGDCNSKKIAPMLFIIFVENAFKYLDLDNENGSVLIDLTVYDNEIIFRCSNTFDKSVLKELPKKKSNSGIGLKNAEKRLKLIYPNSHHLKIEQIEQNYIVELKIDIHD